MDNAAIADTLQRMAELLAVKNEIRFKIQAFERAAHTVESLDKPLSEILTAGGTKALLALPGIGAGIAAKIEELLAKGTCKEYEQLKKSLPPGIEELLQVPNLGPKTALLVAKTLKVKSIADLERAIAAHKVAALPRVGEKNEAKILKGLAILKQGQSRMPLGRALPLANEIEAALKSMPGVGQVARAGSLRRMKDTIGDLDFLVTPRNPKDAAGIIAAFASLPQVSDVLAKGDTKCSIRLENGFQADLRVVPKESFGAALHYFTGSKAHNIQVRELGVKKGLSINEYGINKGGKSIGGATEEEIFKSVGLPFIPPELREGAGEVEAAKAGRLPRLIEAADIKGDLHMHSKWSDGADTIRAMAEAGRALGYEYVALCDHSRVLKMARGLSIEDLRKKNKEIDALNKALKGIRVLKGAEVDILEDGTLDYPDDVLAELEVVVISVHSRFNLDEAAQTRRICRALTNKYATLLAHPTGRLIGERDPYAVNLGEVIKAARDHGKCLELNAQIKRLDLTDASVRRARDAGVTIAINTDSHAKEQLPLGRTYGIGIARRGWLEAKDVLNTLPLAGLLKRLARRG